MTCKGIITLAFALLVTSGAALADNHSASSCTANSDPYTDYACLDNYLGDNFASRLVNYYKLEIGGMQLHLPIRMRHHPAGQGGQPHRNPLHPCHLLNGRMAQQHPSV